MLMARIIAFSSIAAMLQLVLLALLGNKRSLVLQAMWHVIATVQRTS